MEDEQEKNGLISKREKPVVPEPYSFSEEIKNRESWAKIAIAIILTALVSYKIATIDANLDFSNFNFSFTDLLSLILAIFAISMSVALYFKATDTSNRFYDNTFKFTKDISEILGRIEAGFGARLKNLDEGYSGLRDSFQGSIGSSEEIDASKIELEKEIAEKNQILSDLIDQTKLSEDEKTEVLHSLQSKEREILNLTKELKFLKHKIQNNERSIESTLINKVPPSMRKIVFNILESSDIPIHRVADLPIELLRNILIFDRRMYSASTQKLLFKYGIIDDSGSFTNEGLQYIRALAKDSLPF
ncbi:MULTISPECIES: hypothetical protein [Psychrobacter]|jgi:hypothetical protein|uniref:hypothetical protein n=1 Tax=Psychrobacter TaxID=497 RepID=UPI00191B00B2|nr:MULTISPECIES: hypothetical protein [Psychrobacter]MCG3873880.1 hypothetical protein [Psychrobacter sp. Ps7]